jgi:hypothetical protein
MADTYNPPQASQPAAPSGGGLQFEKAEFAGGATQTCTACSAGIHGEYYTINAQAVCPPCRNRASAPGSGIARFVKAAAFGAVAAALGAGIYWAILALTGYEIGLISILVGFMVGAAVRAGSEQRGGWLYQLLAIFLTYTAIVSAYVPLVVKGFNEMAAAEKPAATTKDAPDGTGAPKATPTSATTDADDAVAESEENPSDAAEPREPLGAIGLVIGLFLLILFIYALPFLSGMQNILGLVIIGIGLYQAWKLNCRVPLDIQGPFQAAPAAPAAEVAPAPQG